MNGKRKCVSSCDLNVEELDARGLVKKARIDELQGKGLSVGVDSFLQDGESLMFCYLRLAAANTLTD